MIYIAKERRQLEMREAIEHAKIWGGWIARRQNGDVYWYSCRYTRKEIFEDLPGDLECGMWIHFITKGE